MLELPTEMKWYDILVMLAGGDITKIETITNLTAIEVLNHLTYLKMKERWQSQ